MSIALVGIMRTGLATALLATLLVSGPAGAEDSPPRHGMHHAMMKAADTDGDGRVSRAEADAKHAKRFTELDEDGDGNVSRDAFVSKTTDKIMQRMSREGIEERVGKRFDKIDTDGDQVLSLDEFNAQGQKRFDRMDQDGDGFLSLGEGPRRGCQGKGKGMRH